LISPSDLVISIYMEFSRLPSAFMLQEYIALEKIKKDSRGNVHFYLCHTFNFIVSLKFFLCTFRMLPHYSISMYRAINYWLLWFLISYVIFHLKFYWEGF